MTGEHIRPAKLAEAVASYLEQLILEGALRPGDKLAGERDLAQRLNVSRPSLRSGIALLEQRGLLASDRGGTQIAHPLRDALSRRLNSDVHGRFGPTQDYLEFRGAVEGMTAYLAASRATDRDRRVLGHCLMAMEQAGDADNADDEDGILADRDFHRALHEASHNVVLLHVMTELDDVMRRGLFYNRPDLFRRPVIRRQLLLQHRQLFESIVRGDGELARETAETHVATLSATIREQDSFDHDLERSLRALSPSPGEPPSRPAENTKAGLIPGESEEDSGRSFPFTRFVRTIPRVMSDYLEFRRIVDGLAARLAAERAEEADREAIANALEATGIAPGGKIPDPTQQYEADRRFHFAIYHATGNIVVREVMNTVFTVIPGEGTDDFFCARNGARDFLGRQHKALFDAIMDGKSDRAGRAAERHIQYIHEMLEAFRLTEWRVSVSGRRNERIHLVQADDRRFRTDGPAGVSPIEDKTTLDGDMPASYPWSREGSRRRNNAAG